MSKYSKLENYAKDYNNVCSVFSIIKEAKIEKLPNGQYSVVSIKGSNLGIYDTEEEAIQRLRQVEFFKNKKASSKEDSYSSIMRDLNKNNNLEAVQKFQKEFKQHFDEALISNEENPEEIALEKSKKIIKTENTIPSIIKISAAIQLGDTDAAGKYLANLIKFLTTRISPDNRAKSIDNLKKKIYYLNEYEMASKKVPASSSLGQAITIIKHILIEQKPQVIRSILNSVVRYL